MLIFPAVESSGESGEFVISEMVFFN
jgi:hypothetical protein